MNKDLCAHFNDVVKIRSQTKEEAGAEEEEEEEVGDDEKNEKERIVGYRKK